MNNFKFETLLFHFIFFSKNWKGKLMMICNNIIKVWLIILYYSINGNGKSKMLQWKWIIYLRIFKIFENEIVLSLISIVSNEKVEHDDNFE